MKIKDLLTDESKWTKLSFARDIDGNPVEPTSPEACCWCLVGALYKCKEEGTNNSYEAMLKMGYEIDERFNGWNSALFSWYNDYPERTFEEVKALIEKLDI